MKLKSPFFFTFFFFILLLSYQKSQSQCFQIESILVDASGPNRYGTKVYHYSNYTNQWKGQTNKGEELPDGTYFYVVDRGNGQNLTGWAYLNKAY